VEVLLFESKEMKVRQKNRKNKFKNKRGRQKEERESAFV
jgi:hypothetical protein